MKNIIQQNTIFMVMFKDSRIDIGEQCFKGELRHLFGSNRSSNELEHYYHQPQNGYTM